MHLCSSSTARTQVTRALPSPVPRTHGARNTCAAHRGNGVSGMRVRSTVPKCVRPSLPPVRILVCSGVGKLRRREGGGTGSAGSAGTIPVPVQHVHRSGTQSARHRTRHARSQRGGTASDRRTQRRKLVQWTPAPVVPRKPPPWCCKACRCETRAAVHRCVPQHRSHMCRRLLRCLPRMLAVAGRRRTP